MGQKVYRRPSPGPADNAATNIDIAQTLSPRTVEEHMARVLAKLGITRKDVYTALR